MGTDIYSIIEYVDKEETFDSIDSFAIRCFGEFNLGRLYEFFSLVGNIGNLTNPVVPVRDLPKQMSIEVKNKILLRLLTAPFQKILYQKCKDKGFDLKDTHGYRFITKKELTDGLGLIKKAVRYYNKKEKLVVDPGFFGHTWLYLSELKEAYGKYLADKLKENPEFDYSIAELEATITAMGQLESHGNITRVLFWFS